MDNPADGPLLLSCGRRLHSLAAEAGLFSPTKRDTVLVIDPGGYQASMLGEGRDTMRAEGGWQGRNSGGAREPT